MPKNKNADRMLEVIDSFQRNFPRPEVLVPGEEKGRVLAERYTWGKRRDEFTENLLGFVKLVLMFPDEDFDAQLRQFKDGLEKRSQLVWEAIVENRPIEAQWWDVLPDAPTLDEMPPEPE